MNSRPASAGLKPFLTFWKPSLSRRLTISFTVFGLVIGYAVFIFLAASSTNTFIKLISDHIASASEVNLNSRNAPLTTPNQQTANIVNVAKALQGIYPDLKFDLYSRRDGAWRRDYLNTEGVLQSQAVADPAVLSSLEKVRKNRIFTSSRFFYGAADTVNVKINLSRKPGNETHIISFDIRRMGFINVLRTNLSKAVLFFVLLLLTSHILGHLFSLRLARPIEKLSAEAQTIASGQYERRFTTDRKDEIGILAQSLNTMASRIIDSTRERENLLIGILIALTRSIDAKSPWTAGHSERVTRFSEAIGRGLHLDDDQMHILSISAILHDIGKIAVPEQILDKPGRLTDEEFTVVRKHSQAGADIIASIPSYETILPGILHHHEQWNGQGYPAGLAQNAIPLFARIICIADVYDALTEDRPYRKAWNPEQVRRFFEDQKGKMFDPELVDVFLKSRDDPQT